MRGVFFEIRFAHKERNTEYWEKEGMRIRTQKIPQAGTESLAFGEKGSKKTGSRECELGFYGFRQDRVGVDRNSPPRARRAQAS